MAQRLRALAALSEVLSSILSAHIHGGSQASMMGSDALFWPAGMHADRVLMPKKYMSR